ncbi:hypothetical protein A7K91_14925 [Paenibacillus oryzae]|uniref:Uncharacterized protein n=1 Tax=Paenibacillus oryzae TaxID=1844972 RepID=A0A1A5YTN2_9BACL|nr:hypothetical protein A7K91_14925 [Paenibacillus oryzae]
MILPNITMMTQVLLGYLIKIISIAFRIFDTHMGGWEVKQEKENFVAQKFWESVVKQYSNGRYNKQELCQPKWDGPILYFNKINFACYFRAII